MHWKSTEQRLTKIVATIGRKHGDSYAAMLEQFASSGMDVARLNMSHCDPDYAKEREILQWLHGVGVPDTGARVASLGDLQGPKVRVGQLARENEVLAQQQELVIRVAPESTSSDVLPIPDPLGTAVLNGISQVCRTESQSVPLLLGDGEVVLDVFSPKNGEARARVRVGGPIRSRMGFTPRGVDLDIEGFTAKDRADLQFLIENSVTFVGVSFVRSAEDLRRIRYYIRDTLGCRRSVPLIAKIETASAVSNIRSIVDEADGIMVARGDLGLQLEIEEVPQVQKRLAYLCRVAAKPCIIATQMLESMTFNLEPTRAEVTDVFNAILDGCDAVMLSGETSRGDRPHDTIEMMHRIALRAELWRTSNRTQAENDRVLMDSYEAHGASDSEALAQINDKIAHSVVALADAIGSSLIAAVTTSGASARRISRFRPHMAIVAAGTDSQVMRELLLSYGTYPIVLDESDNMDFDNRVALFEKRLRTLNIVKKGDLLVLCGGQPPWPRGGTNMLKVHIVQ